MVVNFKGKEYKLSDEAKKVLVEKDAGGNFHLVRYFEDGKAHQIAMSMEAFVESLSVANKELFTNSFVKSLSEPMELLSKKKIFEEVKEFYGAVNDIISAKERQNKLSGQALSQAASSSNVSAKEIKIFGKNL